MSSLRPEGFENPDVSDVVREIKMSPIYRRFLCVIRDYGIKTICDFHAHVSSGRNDIIETASDESVNLLPELPFSVRDVNRLYDILFRDEGIDFFSVVFDTPLGAYDLVKRNGRLLTDLDSMDIEEAQKIVPFAVVTPEMKGSQIKGFVERGARGFKMTPRTTSKHISRGRISDISLADMLNPEALRIANVCRLPLVVHLPQLVVSPRMKPSLRGELRRIADKYPDLKIVLAHLGQAQTPAKIEDLVQWICLNDLNDIIWMDVSAVTVPSVLELAFASDIKLVFGTDIDFSLTERGKYIMFKYRDGQRVLADPGDRGAIITALVSTSFGEKLREFVAAKGIDLNSPLLLFQIEGILDAIERLQKGGKPREEVKPILENLFFRNAESLFGVKGLGKG